MKIGASDGNLILSEAGWISMAAMLAGGCAMVGMATANVAVTSSSARLVLGLGGLALMLLAILGTRHARIVFDRAGGTMTISRAPVICVIPPVWTTRARTYPLSFFGFAYVERTMTGYQEAPRYHFALAKEGLPAIMLDATRTPPLVVSDESVRIVLSVTGPLSMARAIALAQAVNEWLGVQAPAQHFDRD